MLSVTLKLPLRGVSTPFSAFNFASLSFSNFSSNCFLFSAVNDKLASIFSSKSISACRNAICCFFCTSANRLLYCRLVISLASKASLRFSISLLYSANSPVVSLVNNSFCASMNLSLLLLIIANLSSAPFF